MMMRSLSVGARQIVGWMGSDGPHYKGVPVSYRSLVPNGVENLLAAGRCIGAPDTCDIYREVYESQKKGGDEDGK